jgi:brefeldin A-resistance guanine nucleotide exchange factor 1
MSCVRFVGSDPGSDEVVLMKILKVLKLLILSKVGLLLTNESICEIMQSTLRCFFVLRF